MFPEKFICRTFEYTTYEKHVNAPIIRKSFNLEKVCENTTLTISGLGFYDAFINGVRVTKGLLSPYISNPDDFVYYDKIDITEHLNKGENVVAVVLGNGMQNCPGGEVWDFQLALFRGSPRMALCIEAGDELIVESDNTFKTADSPIWFDDLRSGEFYDATLEQEGCFLPGFDDSSWDDALLTENPRGEKRICEADPILPRSEIKAVKIEKAVLADYFEDRRYLVKNTQEKVTDRNGYMYDFGVNTAGTVRLKINGKKGQRVEMQCCEFINKDNNPSYANIYFYPDNYSQKDIYICKGDGDEIFEPRFTYHGLRYCVVSGIEESQATEDLLTLVEYSSDIKKAGDFECSDEIANTLQEMAVRSDLANFYYFPTDCPHREKNGWTGDAAASCEHIMLNYHAEKSYQEWVRNICAAQNANGDVPGIVPTGGWGFEWGNGPAWDIAMTIIPYTVYRYTGNKKILEESKESIFRYLSNISNRRNENGLIAFGLADWLQPRRDAGDPSAPRELTDSVMCLTICEMASKIFEILSMPLHKNFADTLYKEIKESIRENYIDFITMTVKSRCQTAQAICIYYGVFDKCELKQAAEVLVDIINEGGDFLDCGIIGLRTVFRVLGDFGYSDLAYKMITRPEFPSYGHFIASGLTALPEDFREQFNDRPASLNHHFLGDISGWFISYIAGIRVNEKCKTPEYVDVKPNFIKSLDSAKAYHDLPSGRISVSWNKNTDGLIELEVECPENLKGDIVLPAGCFFLSDNKNKNMLNVYPLKSGKYTVKQK